MRKQTSLAGVLHRLADLLGEEAARNPDFAGRLDRLLAGAIPAKPVQPRHTVKSRPAIPDIYAERSARGESEFRLWLREQPIDVLRAIVSGHDLDAARRTSKWKDVDKLAAFIADQLQLRSARGASFLRSGSTE
jgi:hypothetical protein